MNEDQAGSWHPKLQEFYGYWRRLHPAGGGLPGRQHFDPLDIAPLMPWVWMVDIVRGAAEPRFRYRLLGTRQVTAMNADHTGRFMDEVHPSFLRGPVYGDYLDVARGETSWRRGAPAFHLDPELYRLERLMLPLARNGRDPDIILALTVYFRRDGTELR